MYLSMTDLSDGPMVASQLPSQRKVKLRRLLEALSNLCWEPNIEVAKGPIVSVWIWRVIEIWTYALCTHNVCTLNNWKRKPITPNTTKTKYLWSLFSNIRILKLKRSPASPFCPYSQRIKISEGALEPWSDHQSCSFCDVVGIICHVEQRIPTSRTGWAHDGSRAWLRLRWDLAGWYCVWA